MTKLCRKCGIDKELGEFRTAAGCVDGTRHTCTPCMKAADARRYRAQREARLAKAKAAYAADPEKFRKKTRNRYAADPLYRSARKARAKKFQHANNVRRRLDPLTSFADRMRARFRIVLKRGGSRKTAPTFKMLGFTPADLVAHLSLYLNQPCEECGCNVTLKGSHIDHIVPLHTARSLDDVLTLSALRNLRLICAPCNLHKQGRVAA